MANTPKQPEDPPSEGGSPVDNSPGQGRNGIAHGQHEQEATGTPNNDRHESETAPSQVDANKS